MTDSLLTAAKSSVLAFDPNAASVTMTEVAIKHFVSKLSAAGDQVLRLSTKTSGCTGYAYVLDLVMCPQDGDEVINLTDALTLAVAPDALSLLRGTEIDLVTEGVNQVVKFNNPNVVAECGCGESFSVSD